MNIRLKQFLFLLALCIPNICFSGYISDITTTPDNPNTTDYIFADIFGDFSTAGITIAASPTVTLLGEDVFIDIFSTAAGCCGAAIPTPFSIQADIGFLSSGNYNLIANLYLNDFLDDTHSQVLSVSAVPIPASIWLFSSAMLGLISLTRRST